MEGKYIAMVKIGPKGQIVIPKEVRDMFGVKANDSLILMADVERGIALKKSESLDEIVRNMVNSALRGDADDGDED